MHLLFDRFEFTVSSDALFIFLWLTLKKNVRSLNLSKKKLGYPLLIGKDTFYKAKKQNN